MSCYVDIYKDFPLRCQEVWKRIESSSKKEGERDLSVTAMLMAAAAGFATPWEHVKDGSEQAIQNTLRHPAHKGISEMAYRTSLSLLSGRFNEVLTTSALFLVEDKFAWKLGHADELDQVRDVGECGNGPKILPEDKNVRFMLKILRNSLAHNNICAFGRGSDEIERLSFFSEDIKYENNNKVRQGWHLATTTVTGFRGFLEEWFNLINKRELRLVMPAALQEDREAA